MEEFLEKFEGDFVKNEWKSGPAFFRGPTEKMKIISIF